MIAFTADNHIGVTSQWSLKERGEDFLKSFEDMTNQIVASSDPDKTIIIGGDLFDTPYPPSFAVEFVQRQIRRIRESVPSGGNCTVLGIDGNHDVADGKWLRVCGIDPLSDEPVKIQPSGLGICGIPYRRSSDVIGCIEDMANRGVRCDILVLHLAFGELNRMGAASDLSSKEIIHHLKTIGVRLVLMGHIHIRQSVVIEGITFAYCGSTEMCSMNEPVKKSFDIIDPITLELTCTPIATRMIAHTVIGNEREFATYVSSLEKGTSVLQAVYVAPDVIDGVRRLRAVARENLLLMRIQVLQPHSASSSEEIEVDRTAGVIGLEQAISSSFSTDSEEAELIRSILRSPDTLKLIVESYMKKGQE